MAAPYGNIHLCQRVQLYLALIDTNERCCKLKVCKKYQSARLDYCIVKGFHLFNFKNDNNKPAK